MLKRLTLVFALLLVIGLAFALNATITLIEPEDNTITNETDLEFKFYFTDPGETNASCNLTIYSFGMVTLTDINNTVYESTNTTFEETLSEGFYAWNINCTDYYNTSTNTSETRWLIVDTSPPEVDWTYPWNDSYSNQPNPDITIWFDDLSELDESSISLTVDGNNYTTSNPELSYNETKQALEYYNSTSNFVDGQIVNVTVYAADEWGHVMAPYEFYFTIDLISPSVNMSMTDNETIGPNNPTTINFTASDDNALEVYCFAKIDNNLSTGDIRIYTYFNTSTTGQSISYNTTWDGTGYKLTNGPHTTNTLVSVEYWGYEPDYYQVFGNYSDVSENITWWTVAYFYKENLSFSHFTFPTEMVEEGVDTFTHKYTKRNTPDCFTFEGIESNDTFVINTSRLALVDSNANDSHNFTIEVFVVDEANNNDSDSQTATIDVTPPTINISTNPSTIDENDWADVNCTVSDNKNLTYPFNITSNYPSWPLQQCGSSPCNKTYQYTQDDDYTFTCTAIDNAKNQDSKEAYLDVQGEDDGDGNGNGGGGGDDDDDDDQFNEFGQFDEFDPVVTLDAPENNAIVTDDTPVFTFMVTDDVDNVLTCQLHINGTLENTVEANEGEITSVGTVSSLENGYYVWDIECEDDWDHETTSETWGFTIQVVVNETQVVTTTEEETGGGWFAGLSGAAPIQFLANRMREAPWAWVILVVLIGLLGALFYFRKYGKKMPF